MALFKFYWLVVREASRHSLDITQAIIFVLLIISGSIAALSPAVKPTLDALDIGGWKIAVITFGLIFSVRLLLAPYWLWREVQKKLFVETEKSDLVLSLDNKPAFESLADAEGRELHNGLVFCARVTNAGGKFLKKCQLTFGVRGQFNYLVTAPFDLRPSEHRDLGVLRVRAIPELRAIVYTFLPEERKIQATSPAWLPSSGTYEIRALSADTTPTALEVELSRTESGWSLAPRLTTPAAWLVQ